MLEPEAFEQINVFREHLPPKGSRLIMMAEVVAIVYFFAWVFGLVVVALKFV